MDLLQVIVVLIILGTCMYLVNTYLPIAQPIKTVINVLVVLVIVVWLLSLFGITTIHVGPRVLK